MKFYYLSSLQKTEIAIVTFLFTFFIMVLRPLLLNIELNSRDAIAYTLIFFVWFGCTMMFSNAYTYESQYVKLKNI